MNVSVDRESILLLFCDYLEKNGLIATLTALETEAEVRSGTPGSAAVRSLALGGKWRELEKALLLRHEEEGQQHELFKRAQYSLAKQLYLETVAALDEVSAYGEPSSRELEEVVRCLERLERLAPSREDYNALRALTEVPTNFFNDWNLQKARKETCGDLLAWCRADFFKGREEKRVEAEKSSPDGGIHQLTLLLVKGKIFEQCEQIIARRCRNAAGTSEQDLNKTSAILDVPSWLEAQPHSMFQAPPRHIQVTETSRAPGTNTQSGGEGQTPNTHQSETGNQPSPQSPLTVPQQTSTATPELAKFPANSPPKLLTPSKKPLQKDTSPSGLAKLSSSPPLATPATLQPKKITSQSSSESSTQLPVQERKGKKQSCESTKTTKHLVEKTDSERAKQEESVSTNAKGEGKKERGVGVGSSSPRECKSKVDRVTEHRDNIEVATEELRLSVREEERDSTQRQPSTSSPQNAPYSSSVPPPDQQTSSQDKAPPPWALQTTPLLQPLQKTDRNSSTPKPSTQHFILSPSTSPVPHHPSSSQATPSGRSHSSSRGGERKQIDFDREVSSGSYRAEAEEEEGVPLLTASWPTATLIGRITDSQAVRSVAFSESGQLVAVGANSKLLRLFSTAPLLLNNNCSGEELIPLHELPCYHRGSIYCLAWSGDRVLASGSNDKSIKLLVCHTDSRGMVCECQGRMNLHNGTVREMVFLTETLLASGGTGEPSLLISDCETMKTVTKLSGHEKQVLSVASGGQRSTVVSGGEDGTVRLWDWSAAGKCVNTLRLSESVPSLSAHEQTVAVAMVDGSCSVYDMRNWGLVTSYKPHSDECRSVRHSPGSGGKWLLTGSYDGSVCLGEGLGGGEWVEVAQHEDKVVQARWHPGGEVFASTSSDKTACFWSLQC